MSTRTKPPNHSTSAAPVRPRQPVPPQARTVGVTYGVVMTVSGLWPLLAPASWHADFPIEGAHWVSALGPYDEHLVRDFGSTLVSLSLLGAYLALHSGRLELIAASAAWALSAAVHLAYHLTTFHHFSAASAASQAASLTITLLVPLWLLWVLLRPPTGAGHLPSTTARGQ